jgi:hypothetical protein
VDARENLNLVRKRTEKFIMRCTLFASALAGLSAVANLVAGNFAAVLPSIIVTACTYVVGLSLKAFSSYIYQRILDSNQLVTVKLLGQRHCQADVFFNLAGALGRLLGDVIGKFAPIYSQVFSYERDGKIRKGSQFLYKDEEIVLDDDGSAQAMVDKGFPNIRLITKFESRR